MRVVILAPLVSPLRPSGSFIYCGSGDSPLSSNYQFSRKVHCFVDALLLTRRDLLIDAGGIDAAFNLLAFADYCIRVWKMGLSVMYEPTLAAVELQIPSKHHEAVEDRIMRLELPRLLAKHGDWLVEEKSQLSSTAIGTRHPCDTRKRILFIEDRVPHPYLGRGYPRSHMMLVKLVEMGYFVTLYPMLEPSEDVGSAYRDVPRDVEILLGHGGKSGLARVLAERHGSFDLIFVTRRIT